MQIYTIFMCLANKCHRKVEISVKKTTIFTFSYIQFNNRLNKVVTISMKDKKMSRQKDERIVLFICCGTHKKKVPKFSYYFIFTK